MGFYIYSAGALTLLAMGVEAFIRTIRVETAEFRHVLRDPDRHGGPTRVRKVFLGRLALYLLEPLLALFLGGLALWSALEDLETLLLWAPLGTLVWLQFRLWWFHNMPHAAVLAMFLFIGGQIFWSELDANDPFKSLPALEAASSD